MTVITPYRFFYRPVTCGMLLLIVVVGQDVHAQEAASGLLQPSALDRDVDAAVVRAVDFLVREQRPSGGWHLELYNGDATSTTSLALMALLAAGHTPADEPYADTFRRGIEYLLQHQQPSGLIVDRTGHGPLYCHGISTLFLAEVVGMTEPQQADAVRTALECAVRALLDAQAVRKDQRHAGGWRYTLISNDSDLSVTAWQLLALRAAKNAGCDIPAEAIERAVEYVRRCQPNGRGSGYSYQPGGSLSPIMTAAGITALQVCAATDGPEFDAAVRYLSMHLPRRDSSYYFYGTYYASIALHQQGDDLWETHTNQLFRELLQQQQPDGHWRGMKGPEPPVGPIYATSLAVLALTVEYGYLPIYQK
ncbi:prenyltransferase [bacterium]|nr:prenyltransferase [bacterium]